MKSWDSAKNRVSGVVPVLLVSSTWDTERCHRYAFARHDGSQTSFAKDLQKIDLQMFLANVEHTWRRAVVFSSFDECCKRRRSSNEKVEVV